MRRLPVPVHVLLFLAPVAATMSPGFCLADELTGTVIHRDIPADFALKVPTPDDPGGVRYYGVVTNRGDLVEKLRDLESRHVGVTIRGGVFTNNRGVWLILADVIREAEAPAPPPLPDVCRCECHERKGVVHVTACCRVCPSCGARIVVAAYDRHVKDEAGADRPNPPPARPPTLIPELGLSIYERPNPPLPLRSRADVVVYRVNPGTIADRIGIKMGDVLVYGMGARSGPAGETPNVYFDAIDDVERFLFAAKADATITEVVLGVRQELPVPDGRRLTVRFAAKDLRP